MNRKLWMIFFVVQLVGIGLSSYSMRFEAGVGGCASSCGCLRCCFCSLAFLSGTLQVCSIFLINSVVGMVCPVV